jgi:hypothetical protein
MRADSERRQTPWARLALAAALFLAGCGEPGARRQLPFPHVVPAAVFPELAQSEKKPEPAPAADSPVQSVPLGGGLLGELPAGDAWRWGGDPTAVLVTHQSGGVNPDALIYVETFHAADLRERPSAELHRFRATVDPEETVADGWMGEDPIVRAVAGQTGLQPLEAGRLVRLLESRTAGRGLGFHPARDSFSGWKWVGRNAGGATLRLARSEGTWAAPLGLPARLRPALRRLADGNTPLAPVARWAMEAEGSAPASRSGNPAVLIIGSATDRREVTGVHLAVICGQSPGCPVAEDLARFLDSIQPADTGRLERLQASAPALLEDLAREAGIPLRPVSEGAASR